MSLYVLPHGHWEGGERDPCLGFHTAGVYWTLNILYVLFFWQVDFDKGDDGLTGGMQQVS